MKSYILWAAGAMTGYGANPFIANQLYEAKWFIAEAALLAMACFVFGIVATAIVALLAMFRASDANH